MILGSVCSLVLAMWTIGTENCRGRKKIKTQKSSLFWLKNSVERDHRSDLFCNWNNRCFLTIGGRRRILKPSLVSNPQVLLEKAVGEIKPDAVFNHFNLKFKQVYTGQTSTAER